MKVPLEDYERIRLAVGTVMQAALIVARPEWADGPERCAVRAAMHTKALIDIFDVNVLPAKEPSK
jgi:hypothetical protein